MGNALRDQLLKAGLVNEKQLKQAVKDKTKEEQRLHGQGKPQQKDEERAKAQKAQAEKAERDRLLNQQKQEEAERKALAAQVRQMIEQNREPKEDGDTPYNFVDEGKVKRLYLSERQRERVGKGVLAIVKLGKAYELVPADTADKIAARDQSAVVLINRSKTQPQADIEDPYAQYQIPDDLMW